MRQLCRCPECSISRFPSRSSILHVLARSFFQLYIMYLSTYIMDTKIHLMHGGTVPVIVFIVEALSRCCCGFSLPTPEPNSPPQCFGEIFPVPDNYLWLKDEEKYKIFPRVRIIPRARVGKNYYCDVVLEEANGKMPSPVRSGITCPTNSSIVINRLPFSNAKCKMRLKCRASYSLDMRYIRQNSRELNLPYSGIQIQFKKDLSSGILSLIEAEFPKVLTISNEDMSSFNGKFIVFNVAKPHLKTEIKLHVMKASNTGNLHIKLKMPGDKIVLETFDQRAECESVNPRRELYFANVGGESVAETGLLRSCLRYENETCANKVLGVSCVQSRFCKKLSLNFHQNGMLHCFDGVRSLEKHYYTGLDFDYYNVCDIPTNKTSALIQLGEDDGKKYKDVTADVFSSDDAMNQTRDPQTISFTDLQGHKTLVDGNVLKLECQYIPYILVSPVLWTVSYVNRTSFLFYQDTGESTDLEYRQCDLGGPSKEIPKVQISVKSSKASLKLRVGMRIISCHSTYWNSDIPVRSSMQINVQLRNRVDPR